MKGKFILTGVLLFLLLIIGGVIFFYEKPKMDNKNKDLQVFNITDNSEIVSIGFEPRDSESFKLVKDEQKGVYLESPYSYRIDREVTDIFDSLSDLNISEFVTENVENRNIYGLSSPSNKLTLVYSDGGSQVLSIGDQSYDGTKFYIERDSDGRIAYVEKGEIEKYLLSLNDVMKKNLLFMNATDLKGITYKAEENELTVIKKDDGWHFEGNSEQELDNEKVDDFKIKLFNTEVNKLISSNEDLNFDEPVITFDLDFGDGIYTIKAIYKEGSEDTYLLQSSYTGDENGDDMLSPLDFILQIDKQTFDSLELSESNLIKEVSAEKEIQ